MFAYCGNNPINYADPFGYWFGYAGRQIKATYFLDGGEKGSALQQLQLSAGTGLPVELHINWRFLSAKATSFVSDCIGDNVDYYSEVTLFCSFLHYYDKFRFEGLDNGDSFRGAFIFSFGPDFIDMIPGIGPITDECFSNLEEQFVNNNRPSPTEAAANKTNHIATKNAAVAVGGAMRCIMFGQLEVRDLYGIH